MADKDTLLERARAMRLAPTNAEKVFKKRLMAAKIGFSQQYVIGCYIVDFLVGNIIIELDGSSHIGKESYDKRRDEFLTKQGYKVVRIKNKYCETFDLNFLAKRKKKPKSKKLSKQKMADRKRRQEQQNRQAREAALWDVVQMPNGDFKKVRIAPPVILRKTA